MKAVILAGGKGTRISEESRLRPKPMVEVGGRPMLWHIMKIYAAYGHTEFVVCCGYKGHMIKEYFLNYYRKCSDMTLHLDGRKPELFESMAEPWRVTMVDTGLETLTAGRIKKIEKYLGGEEEFLLTYGDGVADIDVAKLVGFHHRHGKALTISVTRPEGRFGGVCLDPRSKLVTGFQEKSREDQPFINIGFMVCSRRVFDFLGDGSEMLERGPFERLVEAGEMAAYEHPGFWSPMDNMKDKSYLEGLWESGQACWMVNQKETDRR